MTTVANELIWSWTALIFEAISLRLSFTASDSFWKWLIDTLRLADPVPSLVRRPSPTTKLVRLMSLFVCIKLTMGMISELLMYEIGGIKKVSVQIPIQLVGRHV
jgi:hypothetical protein